MNNDRKNNLKKTNFLETWNELSHSQKNIIFKLGQSGWQLDHLACDRSAHVAKIIHYNGHQGRVSFLGEVEFEN
tara:strand:+ start:47548 stop:47769 length:222 start_codon:yes stop_codon:yes gene_type:complete